MCWTRASRYERRIILNDSHPIHRETCQGSTDPDSAVPDSPGTGLNPAISSNEGQAVLSIADLEIAFSTPSGMATAVKSVSFDIRKGEIYALVGESGCGKSSTAHAVMRLINQINAPHHRIAGTVLYKDKNLLDLTEDQMCTIRGKEISMIFQDPLNSLNPLYRSGRQVYEAIRLDNIPKPQAWQQVLKLFEQVRLSDPDRRIGSYPQELSGGMRQRVMIGMMLSRSPNLLIADEPTTALDVTIQARILELILSIRDTLGMSVWVITHDFGIVAEIADRVGVMYAGVMVEEGGVFDIFDAPCHPYTRMLMESLPSGTKHDRRLLTIPGTLPDPFIPFPGCPFHDRCPDRTKICAEKMPGMQELTPTHKAACWHVSDRMTGE